MPDALPRVFISYARADSTDFVDRLEIDLKAHQFYPWVDRRGLEGGTLWLREIQQAIDKCQALVVVLSPAAEQSDYVLMEYSYALKTRKLVIPALYRPTTTAQMALDILQQVDFQKNYGEGLRQLVLALNRLKPPVAQPTPAQPQSQPKPVQAMERPAPAPPSAPPAPRPQPLAAEPIVQPTPLPKEKRPPLPWEQQPEPLPWEQHQQGKPGDPSGAPPVSAQPQTPEPAPPNSAPQAAGQVVISSRQAKINVQKFLTRPVLDEALLRELAVNIQAASVGKKSLLAWQDQLAAHFGTYGLNDTTLEYVVAPLAPALQTTELLFLRGLAASAGQQPLSPALKAVYVKKTLRLTATADPSDQFDEIGWILSNLYPGPSSKNQRNTQTVSPEDMIRGIASEAARWPEKPLYNAWVNYQKKVYPQTLDAQPAQFQNPQERNMAYQQAYMNMDGTAPSQDHQYKGIWRLFVGALDAIPQQFVVPFLVIGILGSIVYLLFSLASKGVIHW